MIIESNIIGTFNLLEEVTECAVVYKENQFGVKSIQAYISIEKRISKNEILKFINKILPDYIIPKNIEICSQIPKNRNGKIDRKRLEEE